jgi:hypothetical protein
MPSAERANKSGPARSQVGVWPKVEHSGDPAVEWDLAANSRVWGTNPIPKPVSVSTALPLEDGSFPETRAMRSIFARRLGQKAQQVDVDHSSRRRLSCRYFDTALSLSKNVDLRRSP